MKKYWKKPVLLLGVVLVIVIIYIAYVVLTYERMEDYQKLSVKAASEEESPERVQTGQVYGAFSYNAGFGAYLPEFSFFMDGGTESRAKDRESVYYSIEGAAALMKSYEPDFLFLQEVDLSSTRSYHINQYELFCDYFGEMQSTFAVNYDSAYLMVPLLEPHGKSNSGIATFSACEMTEGMRRSLPISDSVMKLVDLDRCISISRLPVENGKELVLINVHMSAYGSDEEVREGQIGLLTQVMEEEYAKGNYVITGGDYNHNLKLLGDVDGDFASWAYPFPREKVPEHFAFCIDAFSREEKEQLWDTSRNADIPYDPEVTYTITLDGFIISDNVECVKYEHINTGYAYSDHEPVYMEFRLK
ncbi:MAG: endonuclease/exonuclease/phosphatase family protein [Lachnospiraceae bacterium]|nr:endonuclease/exonuclease/phosphatase family protein [Lachnospiraceae bacterium]